MTGRVDWKSVRPAWCWLYGLWCTLASVHTTRH